MSFSFETILGIIFFIVFFILPAFSKKKGSQEEDEAAPKPPTKAGGAEAGRPVAQAPAQPQRAQGQARASTSTQGAPAPQAQKGRGPLTAGSIEEALEEIRARVRDAQMQEDAGRPTAPARPRQQTQPGRPAAQHATRTARSDTGDRSLVSGEARRIGDTGKPRTPSVGSEASATAPGRRPSASAQQSSLGSSDVAAPLEVTRRNRGRPRRTARDITDSTSPTARKTDALPPGTLPAARLSPPVLATDRSSLITGMIWHEILSEPAAKRRLRRTRSRHP